MLSKDLFKHGREFLRALANHKYEKTDDGGILFPQAGAIAIGVYSHDVNGEDVRHDRNNITDQGLAHLLNVGLYSTSKISNWYIAPYGGNVSPQANWTAANFATNSTEITSTTEGYTETTRQSYVGAAAAAGTVDGAPGIIASSASRASFTIATASSLSIYGAGLLSSNVRGDTSGVLISATKFSTARILANTDVFNCGYAVGLRSA